MQSLSPPTLVIVVAFIQLKIAYVYDMFALIALLIVWTTAAREKTNLHIVNITCGASHFNRLFQDSIDLTSASIDNKKPKTPVRQSSYLRRHFRPHLCVVARDNFSRYDAGAAALNFRNLFSSDFVFAGEVFFIFALGEDPCASSSPVRSTNDTFFDELVFALVGVATRFRFLLAGDSAVPMVAFDDKR